MACTAGTGTIAKVEFFFANQSVSLEERCECMGTTCASDALECVDGICAAKGVVPIQTNPPAVCRFLLGVFSL